jgi:hypothetical protein
MRLLSIIVFTVVLISNTFGQTTPTTQVKTIADLVALRIPTINNRLSALVTGRVTENDGGGGVFFYEAASVVSTNLGTVFKPAASAGRWVRQYSGDVNAVWFGAIGNGVADDTAALQAAITFASVYLGDVSKNYIVTSAMTIPSNRKIRGNGATITTTANADVFAHEGTELAHLSNIEITGVKFVGQQASFSNYAIDLRWVDYLLVKDCQFSNIKMVYTGELDSEAYADVDVANIQKNQIVTGNRSYSTLTETESSPVFLRYVKQFDISNNVLIGHTTAAGGGLEVFGGNADPAANGADGNALKCFTGTINGNTLQNYISGVNVAQAYGVTVDGNSLDTCGEALWVGRGDRVTFSNNTIVNQSVDAVFQTQGINHDVMFIGNSVNITGSNNQRVFYIGSEWTTEYNTGPISFINNTVTGNASASTFYDVGRLIIRGNVCKNMIIQFFNKANTIEIENNSFSYDAFLAGAPENSYWLKLVTFNSTMTGLPGVTTGFTIIRNNQFFDETLARTTGEVISVYDPGTASNLLITGNTFKTAATLEAIMLRTTSATIALTSSIKENFFGGTVDLNSQNLAVTSNIYWDANKALNGQDYFGAAPTDGTIHKFSIGSRVLSNAPLTDEATGWLCEVAGSPGTWAKYGWSDITDLTPIEIHSATQPTIDLNDTGTGARDLGEVKFFSDKLNSRFSSIEGYQTGGADQVGIRLNTFNAAAKNAVNIDNNGRVYVELEDLFISTAGKGLWLKEGSNARMGTATLVGGTIAVANTSVTANTRIFISRSTTGGTEGHLSTTQIASTSFTVNSTSFSDTSTVNWLLIEPIP